MSAICHTQPMPSCIHSNNFRKFNQLYQTNFIFCVTLIYNEMGRITILSLTEKNVGGIEEQKMVSRSVNVFSVDMNCRRTVIYHLN